eukprot:3731763-Rhodomonas_salina.1
MPPQFLLEQRARDSIRRLPFRLPRASSERNSQQAPHLRNPYNNPPRPPTAPRRENSARSSLPSRPSTRARDVLPVPEPYLFSLRQRTSSEQPTLQQRSSRDIGNALVSTAFDWDDSDVEIQVRNDSSLLPRNSRLRGSSDATASGI